MASLGDVDPAAGTDILSNFVGFLQKLPEKDWAEAFKFATETETKRIALASETETKRIALASETETNRIALASETETKRIALASETETKRIALASETETRRIALAAIEHLPEQQRAQALREALELDYVKSLPMNMQQEVLRTLRSTEAGNFLILCLNIFEI